MESCDEMSCLMHRRSSAARLLSPNLWQCQFPDAGMRKVTDVSKATEEVGHLYIHALSTAPRGDLERTVAMRSEQHLFWLHVLRSLSVQQQV